MGWGGWRLRAIAINCANPPRLVFPLPTLYLRTVSFWRVVFMFGTFQRTCLRIEVPVAEQLLRESLTRSDRLQQWLFPQRLSAGLPEQLHAGLTFTSQLGMVQVRHYIQQLDEQRLCLILSQGIDGFHEWRWGDGWVQSRLEGVSALPLALGQTLALVRLRQFLMTHSQAHRVGMGG